MIEVFLSTDGKHTVHVQAQENGEMNKLLPYAKALYKKIVEELGTKPQLWGEVMNGRRNSGGQFGIRIDTPKQAEDVLAPRCPVHKTPMKQRQGKFGDFWSCGTKLANGNWCRETYNEM